MSLIMSGCAVAFFSTMAFWSRNALLFMLAGGASFALGAQWYDTYTNIYGLTISLLFIAYSLVCLGFAFRIMFFYYKKRNAPEDD